MNDAPDASLHSPWIHAASAASFAELVIGNSERGPVLANFWSQKAGPCLRLYPLLDKLVHHYGGRLLLINIDADQEIGIAKDYGVNSVPTLKLFRHGKVVETFHGYQSQEDLQQRLDRYVARDSDRILPQAIEYYARGETRRAREMIAEAIVGDPANPRLPLALCKLLRHEGRYRDALDLIARAPEAVAADPEIRRLGSLLELSLIAGDCEEDLPQAGTLAEKKRLAACHMLENRPADALALLAEMMDADPGFEDEYPRRAMLTIFSLLEEGDALIGEYRPRLRRCYS